MANDITVDQGHLLFGRTLTGVISGDADPHTFIPRLTRL
jgi:aryl-alcohol dehydrogenase